MHNLIWTGDHQSGRWCWRCTGAARVLHGAATRLPTLRLFIHWWRLGAFPRTPRSGGSHIGRFSRVVSGGTTRHAEYEENYSTVRSYRTSRRSRLQKGLSSHLIGLLSAHCEPRIRQCCPRPFNYVVCPPATSFLTTTARYAHTR
jgi:hypothetical protein